MHVAINIEKCAWPHIVFLLIYSFWWNPYFISSHIRWAICLILSSFLLELIWSVTSLSAEQIFSSSFPPFDLLVQIIPLMYNFQHLTNYFTVKTLRFFSKLVIVGAIITYVSTSQMRTHSGMHMWNSKDFFPLLIDLKPIPMQRITTYRLIKTNEMIQNRSNNAEWRSFSNGIN